LLLDPTTFVIAVPLVRKASDTEIVRPIATHLIGALRLELASVKPLLFFDCVVDDKLLEIVAKPDMTGLLYFGAVVMPPDKKGVGVDHRNLYG